MKIALITDTHWGARGDSAAFAEYFNRFYYDYFFPYLAEHGINRIFHLGDIVDRRSILILSPPDIYEDSSSTVTVPEYV